MPVVCPSSSIEEWLGRSADSWALLSDGEYRTLVERWRQVFAAALEGPSGVQGPEALPEFQALLPASVLLFNGVSVPRAAVTGARHPHAYRATQLRSVPGGLANEHD